MTTNTLACFVVMVSILVAVVSGGYLLIGVFSEQSSDEVPVTRRDRIMASQPISLRLPAGQAGVVEDDSGARIDVPQGATEERATVSIAEVKPPPSPLDVRRAFDFSVDGSRLVGPVTVHVPFELEPGQDASSIRALHWDEDRGAWEPVPGLVDESAGTIAVTTDRLRLFSSLSVKVEASCAASPGEAEAGETLRVVATGTSFTLGTIGIYMAPAVARAGDGVFVIGGPSVRTAVTTVGRGDSFELTYDTALTEPGEYRVSCRVFWASQGTGENLVSPSATVTVGRDGRPSVNADPRIERTYEQLRPVYLGDENDIIIEVRTSGGESSGRFDLVDDCVSTEDGRAARPDGIGSTGGTDPGATGTRSIYIRVPHDPAPGEYRPCARLGSPRLSGTLVLAPGETERLRASATTRSGHDAGRWGFDWSSSAPEIATVSRDGVVTGVAPGEAVIAVHADGAGAWIKVEVSAARGSTAATERPVAGFTENFLRPIDTDRWLLYGSADHLWTEGSIQLTVAQRKQLGFLLLRHPVRLHGSSIEFSFEIGGGTGADGLGLLLLKSIPDFSRIDPAHHAGGGWGSRYLEGYVVAFDTFLNRAGRWSLGGRDFHSPVADPSGNFVALIELGAGGDVLDMDHLATRNLSVNLRESGPFEAEVVLCLDGNVRVYLSNDRSGMSRTLLVDHAIEDFDRSYTYFGFIGATGASTDRHIIRSVKFRPHRLGW